MFVWDEENFTACSASVTCTVCADTMTGHTLSGDCTITPVTTEPTCSKAGVKTFTCKHNAQLSAGRVQTPTLAMIVKREEEILKFRPKDYFPVKADSADIPHFIKIHATRRDSSMPQRLRRLPMMSKAKEEFFPRLKKSIASKRLPPLMI